MYRLAEHLAAVHHQIAMQAGFGAGASEGRSGTAGFQPQDLGLGAVGARRGSDDLDGVRAPTQNHGSGTVAEEHAGLAVLPAHEPAEHLHANDENAAVLLQDTGAGDVEGQNEAGTTGAAEIESRHLPRPQPLLQKRGSVWTVRLGRVGGDDDLVDVGRLQVGVVECRLGRGGRQIDGALVVVDDAAALDPGTSRDPLVGGVDEPRPVVVGHAMVRRIGTQPE